MPIHSLAKARGDVREITKKLSSHTEQHHWPSAKGLGLDVKDVFH